MTEMLAEIRLWAPDFEPENWHFCQGQTLQIDYDPAMFALLGTSFGGDGRNTFALPNLTPLKADSTALNYIICTRGIFPSRQEQNLQYVTNDPLAGDITLWAAPYIEPKGFVVCNGQQLPINTLRPLYDLLGTTYGGDGSTTFALPDLPSPDQYRDIRYICSLTADSLSEPYVGEVRLTAAPQPPQGWQFCQGQMLNISDHMSMYALLGPTFGGDGRITFALPELAPLKTKDGRHELKYMICTVGLFPPRWQS